MLTLLDLKYLLQMKMVQGGLKVKWEIKKRKKRVRRA